ncbi:MAG: hypothetical protein HY343_04575 [Lentisphaerae bacterium]|nr:hypothetical protein [Lentisphaerota bacterium]
MIGNIVGWLMFVVDAPPITEPVTAPAKGPAADYGEYILSYNDCRDCYGENLGGKPSHQLQPSMPWKFCDKMDDEELTAAYR